MEIINLIGAGGHAKVIVDIIQDQGNAVNCLYDAAPKCEALKGHPVHQASEYGSINEPMIICIGANHIRQRIAQQKPANARYATAIHPSAIVSDTATIAPGTVVMQGAIIQAEANIGRHCIVNTGASVDHECQIADFVHLAPHSTLCGNVHVGEGTLIGAGAVVIPGIKIGKWCTIGAGAVVVCDLPDHTTAYGNPCRIKPLPATE